MVTRRVRVKEKFVALGAGQTAPDCFMKHGSQVRKASERGRNIKETTMARHKKHERKKELDRKRHRRQKAIKAAIKKAKAEKA